MFDTPDRALRKERCILRLRRYGSRWTVTYKGTPERDPHFKSRVELETKVDNPRSMRALFEALGYGAVFRYQKYRTEYGLWRGRRRGKPVIDVAVDETPIGSFAELEGSRRSIDWLAKQLGRSRSDYITASYGALYLDHCARQKTAPGDMIFDAGKGRERERRSRPRD